jgi:hypothetical protein
MLVYSYLFFEVLAFLVALLKFSKIKHTEYRYFVPYLLFVVVFEMGSIFNWFTIKHQNLWSANITMTISFLYYSFFLFFTIKTQSFKKWIARLTSLSIFCAFVNMSFFQGFWKLDTVTILMQFAVIILITCLYFYELMNYTEKTLVIIKLPGFWLNTGLLFFCLAEFLFFSAFAYMAYEKNYHYLLLFHVISNIANAILYSCLTISFICFRKTSN